jgi:hypothetical protein
MKIKKIALSIAALSLISIPSFADEDASGFSWLDKSTWPVEVAGEVLSKVGVFTSKGASHNPKRNANRSADEHYAGELFRSEITAKLFINQEVADGTSWHAELQANKDGNGVDGYDFTRNYSQFDWLRELYVDTKYEGINFRLGKQQVVWGKADGVKFLDIINPTDFRHWGQDSMSDSRIPIWMVTGEYAIGDTDSVQVVYVPQVDITNQIPGLYNTSTGDQGQPFVPLGMETMFGQKNGFMSIGPEMGTIASAFVGAAAGGAFAPATSLSQIVSMTVSGFTSMPAGSVPAGLDSTGLFTGNQVLGGMISNMGLTTNLFGGTLNTSNPTTMFDYMGDTTFATFNAFAGMRTKHVKNHADNLSDGNLGIRYSGATDIGLNYTFNYYYHYDNNPVIDIEWQNGAGQALTVAATQDFPGFTTVRLMQNGAVATGPATMVFNERQNRINTIGTSFDYAIDNDFAPVILRSEIVYDKDTLQPVVDLGKLAYGDLQGAFQNERADFLNYVIGLDVTVMTNLFVSFQFMDKWNLDYKDESVQYAGNTKAYGKFTANPATMSLSNGFKPAEEHQIMYTFFLSKPLLENDALRVNNIFLYENDNGGYWDRFDLEYSYSDDVVLSAAYNQYGGDDNGVFGQFKKMSNAQVGFKYIF